MRIVFFGASELGYKCCQSILSQGYDVVKIVSIPEIYNIKFRNEKDRKEMKNVLYKDFSYLARSHSIPYLEINGSVNQYTEDILSVKPDLILVIGWYYMLPEKILKCAEKGAMGIHGSLLPKYRGNAPFVWAMINGEKKTGVSLFYFDDGIDTGDIIGQEEIEIGENDTIADILKKAEESSVKLLLRELPLIEANSNQRTKQDHQEATIFPKRTPLDGEIDWNMEPEKIKNFIRAQTKPYPGAFTIIGGKKVIIWDANIESI